jgi:hypothetical protein
MARSKPKSRALFQARTGYGTQISRALAQPQLARRRVDFVYVAPQPARNLFGRVVRVQCAQERHVLRVPGFPPQRNDV